ncbi:MAG TPA: carbohydrate kinase family protein [Ignavibacteriaceae bacterium]|nr:carbohydrate kinase family protein [Ignavibacteriaceae bacterium]
MKLLVIGHSVEDHIDQGGMVQTKPGGIYYSASALQNFKNPEDEIFLCTSVSRNNYGLFKNVYENLNTKYLQFIDSIPFVYLKIQDKGEREECYGSLTGSLALNLEDVGSFDGIYLNMVTGYDISLGQLNQIREKYKGLIYMDVHTFSRGVDGNMKRQFRVIPEFNLWAKSVDIIQVNTLELMTLSPKGNAEEIIYEVLSRGPQFLILTKGESGAEIFILKENKISSISRPAINIELKNKVGCGDVFGSIFFYSYLANRNIIKSLESANIAGGCAASYKSLEEFKKLKEDVVARLD